MKVLLSKLINILNEFLTFEQPGVNAPGTPKNITFLPFVSSAVFILLAGESSNKSTDGNLSPTYNIYTQQIYSR